MIELTNVSKWYGPVQVLTDCSVKINKGDVLIFVAFGGGLTWANAVVRI